MGAKHKILEAAIDLFCQQGFKTTGIDLVLKKAGVAKMSLYYHFPSKDDLVSECLQVLDQRNFDWYCKQLAGVSDNPVVQLRNAIAPLHLAMIGTQFSGCPFVRAAGEYPEPTDAAHQRAIEHKERFRNLFQRLAEQAKLEKPAELADQIQILFEGTMALFQVRGDKSILDAADKSLSALIDYHRSTHDPNILSRNDSCEDAVGKSRVSRTRASNEAISAKMRAKEKPIKRHRS